MPIIMTRQVSEDQKEDILKRDGRHCFATGHPIGDGETVYFDHIRSFSSGGPSTLDNIAPMCKTHNESKGRLPLLDFRTKIRIDQFFDHRDSLTLRDQLDYLLAEGSVASFGTPVPIVKQEENEITIEVLNDAITYPLYTCPTTKWKFFYAVLPVEVINSDDDHEGEFGLQPRYLINQKVFDLYRHFFLHPVLQPSLARLSHQRILVFDGQHKIAGLLWHGIQRFELKVYVNPDTVLLNETNISAHDQLAQMKFYSSIMVEKLGRQFGKRFDEYRDSDNGQPKTEKGFVDYLREVDRLTAGNVNKRFRSYLYDSVLDPSKNKLARLVSKGNRSSTEYPLTIDMLSKSIFSYFLYREPVTDDMASPQYRREAEIKNVIELCNFLDAEALSRWDPKKTDSDPIQRKLNRLFRSKSILAWSSILFDAVCAKLEMRDSEDREQVFYRTLDGVNLNKIQSVVQRLCSWHQWDSPGDDLDRKLSDNKSNVKQFFKDKGLTSGYLMGAPE